MLLQVSKLRLSNLEIGRGGGSLWEALLQVPGSRVSRSATPASITATTSILPPAFLIATTYTLAPAFLISNTSTLAPDSLIFTTSILIPASPIATTSTLDPASLIATSVFPKLQAGLIYQKSGYHLGKNLGIWRVSQQI